MKIGCVKISMKMIVISAGKYSGFTEIFLSYERNRNIFDYW